MQTPTFFAGGLHAGWCHFLDALRDVGLAEGLSYVKLIEHLGADAPRPPRPRRFVGALHRYYDAEGDRFCSLARRREDGYAAVELGEPMNATRWLARLISAAPHLSGFTVAREPFAALSGAGSLTPLPTARGWVELVDVVDATNQLLSQRSDERFVPLRITPHRESYVRLDWARAALLDEVGLLELDWIDSFEAPRAKVA